MEIYNRLFKHYSSQHWWPARTPEEVIIGAILTQNTAWQNVEKAIENLKKMGACDLESIDKMPAEQLKEAIKPAGFFNQKAGYLKNMASFILSNGGLEKLALLNTQTLRNKLLSVRGIGKETADSILLYAFNRPIFVIDAYTKRLMERHELSKKLDYDSLQRLFMENLPHDAELFNEYHALIVRNAKEHCRKKPVCDGCPLEGL